MKKLFLLLFSVNGLAFANTCQITSPLPVPVSIQGCTFSGSLPSNSTSYIQNTLTPTTTTQKFSVQTATVTDSFTNTALAGTGNRCVRATSTGLLSASASDCGTGSGSGGSALSIGYGTSSGFTQISTGAATGLIFDQSQFLTSLTGGTSVFATITYSTNNVTGSYVSTSTDTMIVANCGSACTVTLSTTGFNSGKVFMVTQAGAGNVTVSPAAGTISGGSTALMNQQYSELDIIWDGSNFWVK